MGLLERELEDILYQHPYLIKEDFIKGRRQIQFEDNTRLDIAFFFEDVIYVIELKKDILSISTVDQIIGYIENLQKENGKAAKGIIIGKKPTDKEGLNNYINHKGYAIEIEYFDVYISTIYKLCKECRRVNYLNQKKCKYCGCDEWISAYLSDH